MGNYKKYTICVDFDGVIHSYISQFDPDNIPDPPVEGAIEFLTDMWEEFNVVIHTTRAELGTNRRMIRDWLKKWGLHRDIAEFITITDKKQAALIYLDDRAIRFKGPGSFPTVRAIHQAKPWNKRD